MTANGISFCSVLLIQCHSFSQLQSKNGHDLRPVLSRRFRVDLGPIDRVCPSFSDRFAYSDPIDRDKYSKSAPNPGIFFDRFGIDREPGMPRSLVNNARAKAQLPHHNHDIFHASLAPLPSPSLKAKFSRRYISAASTSSSATTSASAASAVQSNSATG
jgi:hypothetical protein